MHATDESADMLAAFARARWAARTHRALNNSFAPQQRIRELKSRSAMKKHAASANSRYSTGVFPVFYES